MGVSRCLSVVLLLLIDAPSSSLLHYQPSSLSSPPPRQCQQNAPPRETSCKGERRSPTTFLFNHQHNKRSRQVVLTAKLHKDGNSRDDKVINKKEKEEPAEVNNNSSVVDLGQQSSSPSLEEIFSTPIVEVTLACLVILSSFIVAVGTLESLPISVMNLTKFCELAISAVFTVEYVLRWKLNDFSAKYVVQPLAVIDLIAILPALIKIVMLFGIGMIPAALSDGSAALISLRMLRILRLQRVLVDYETFERFELALGLNPSDTRPYQLQLARVVISIFTLLSVTAGLIYSTEHVANECITDYFTALYFSLSTLSTVGYGDIVPVTTAGRAAVSAAILVGSAVVPAQAAVLVDALFNRRQEQEQQEKKQQQQQQDDEKLLEYKKDDDNKVVAVVNSEEHKRKNDDDDDLLSRIVARLDGLEQKVDETNARIDRVLAVLEATSTKKEG